MKKFYLLVLLALNVSAHSQDAVKKVSKNYFRSDPFAMEFSSFLKHLINDPTLKDKELYQRSDTGLFYLHGFYSSHNPFFFKPKKVEVVLAEVEMQYADTLPDKDTIMLYQLVAYSEPDADGIKEVKREFEKLHKSLNKGFSSTKYQEQKSGGEVVGAWYNYFVPTHAVAPVSIMWGKTKVPGEVALNITIRMKPSYNQATLAAPWIPTLRRN
ncbi:MAG TPA: hypothetical protein VF476_06040 [Chitinophagaceae bacterium]